MTSKKNNSTLIPQPVGAETTQSNMLCQLVDGFFFNDRLA
jgi:hypothetical protein